MNVNNFTGHALKRMSKRNISESMIDTVIDDGRHIHCRGADIFFYGKKESKKKPEKQGRKLNGLIVIIINGRIKTTYCNSEAIKYLRN